MNVVHENVLVKVIAPPTEKNGVKLPDADTTQRRGVVIRFGEAVPSSLNTVFGAKPTVQYKEYYDGSEVTIENEKFIVMNYKDILLIE